MYYIIYHYIIYHYLLHYLRLFIILMTRVEPPLFISRCFGGVSVWDGVPGPTHRPGRGRRGLPGEGCSCTRRSGSSRGGRSILRRSVAPSRRRVWSRSDRRRCRRGQKLRPYDPRTAQEARERTQVRYREQKSEGTLGNAAHSDRRLPKEEPVTALATQRHGKSQQEVTR